MQILRFTDKEKNYIKQRPNYADNWKLFSFHFYPTPHPTEKIINENTIINK